MAGPHPGIQPRAFPTDPLRRPVFFLLTCLTALNFITQPPALLLFMTQERDSGNSELTRDAVFEEFGLTAREREIAVMLAEGLSYKEISAGLFISLSTVQTHVTRIYAKTGVNSNTELSMKLRS